MTPYINYEFTSADELHKEIFQYWFNDCEMCLMLDMYTIFERKSKRFLWREVQGWERLAGWHTMQMKREDVPVTEEIRAEVLGQFIAKLTVESAKGTR